MLKKLTLALTLASAALLPAAADEVVVDGIKYITDASTHTAYVTYFVESNYSDETSENANYYVGDITVPETITVDDETYTVTSIGDRAFGMCNKLTGIMLPSTITSIGYEAFYSCSALQSIGDMPALKSIGGWAFYLCSALQSIGDMPTITSIAPYAFSSCSALQSIGDMPAITSIGTQAFWSCSALQSIGDMLALTTIDNSAFQKCFALQSIGDMPALTSIGSNAFYECKALQSIGDMSSIKTIGYSAFRGTGLRAIGNMPELTTIGADAFYECKALQSIGDMPALTAIEASAFGFCTALQSIGDMPALKSIGGGAFMYVSMSDLYLPSTVTEVGVTAFTSPIMVHFAGNTLPALSGASSTATFCVPAECVEAYRQALPDMPVYNIIIDGLTDYDLTVSAREGDSDVLKKVNEGFDNDMAYNVVNLKVSGTINSYDIMVMRNKMLNLRRIDLSNASIVDCAYEYYTGYHTENNIVGNYMFFNMKIAEIFLPEGIEHIGFRAFESCSNLREINLPQSLTSLEGNAFINCSGLTSIVIPPAIKSIPNYCFMGCSRLQSVEMPPTLSSIGQQAFSGCNALTEFRIPAGISSIGYGAIPYTVRDVYTYTIQPTSITQETFGSDTYLNATLHVPETSEKLYYWDTQWSQFQTIENFNEPYSYFYLDDKDLVEDPDTPRIEGETDEETGDKKNPDADLGKDSGLIVDGDNSQDLGNVDLEHDGTGNGATIIGGDSNTSESGGNVNVDMLNIKIPVLANKWYFFAFPFDIAMENIKFNGQMVWRYYDGEWRALHGSGSWKNVKDGKLERGKGYIFQGSKAGTLTLSIPKVSFDANNWIQELKQYVADAAQDASWNFIGNPFQSFYELADLGFDGPITCWNPNTNSYEAYSPLDDDLAMYPFMAFFVQKPEGVDGVEFDSKHRETKNQKNDPNHRAKARKRRLARSPRATERLLITLAVSDGTNSDRTRVVFNSRASEAYEVGVDASKFVSADAPQIYSLDSRNVRYSINERPAGDGTVRLGFYAPAAGTFTIECTRTDCPATLYDAETGKTVTLEAGNVYEFTAKKGYDDGRFVLNAKGADVTSIKDVEAAEGADSDFYGINGVRTDGSRKGVMIEVKGNEAKKVIRK